MNSKDIKHTIMIIGEFSIGDRLHILPQTNDLHPGLVAEIIEFPKKGICTVEVGGLLKNSTVEDLRKAIRQGRIKHFKKTEGGME